MLTTAWMMAWTMAWMVAYNNSDDDDDDDGRERGRPRKRLCYHDSNNRVAGKPMSKPSCAELFAMGLLIVTE